MTERTPNQRNTTPLSPKQKRVGSTLLTYGVIAVVIGFIVAAILFQTWLLFFIGLIVFVPYAFILMAPDWLARTSRAAQGTDDGGEPRATGPKES